MNKQHIGSDLDAFLKQDGLLAECEAGAFKRVVAWQLEQEIKRRRIPRARLASRMKTSRATRDRLFAKDESSVTLQLLEQAAMAHCHKPIRSRILPQRAVVAIRIILSFVERGNKYEWMILNLR